MAVLCRFKSHGTDDLPVEKMDSFAAQSLQSCLLFFNND